MVPWQILYVSRCPTCRSFSANSRGRAERSWSSCWICSVRHFLPRLALPNYSKCYIQLNEKSAGPALEANAGSAQETPNLWHFKLRMMTSESMAVLGWGSTNVDTATSKLQRHICANCHMWRSCSSWSVHVIIFMPIGLSMMILRMMRVYKISEQFQCGSFITLQSEQSSSGMFLDLVMSDRN